MWEAPEGVAAVRAVEPPPLSTALAAVWSYWIWSLNVEPWNRNKLLVAGICEAISYIKWNPFLLHFYTFNVNSVNISCNKIESWRFVSHKRFKLLATSINIILLEWFRKTLQSVCLLGEYSSQPTIILPFYLMYSSSRKPLEYDFDLLNPLWENQKRLQD